MEPSTTARSGQDQAPEAGGGVPAAGATGRPAPARLRNPWLLGLGGVIVLGLVLRLWGLRYGLPFAYNLDERSHFVPRTVDFFDSGSLDPHYQLNPSGLMYAMAAGLAVFYRGSRAVLDAWSTDPGEVWLVSRVVSALIATAAIGAMYAAGARLFERRAGLLAAGLMATSFLPVHYGHLALNDAPSLLFVALSLVGTAGVLRDGRLRDYALAGAAAGVGIGFKYNSGYVLLPLLTAAAIRLARGDRRSALGGSALGLAAGVAGFAISDPYALIDLSFFRSELRHLSDYTKGGLLLGETQESGYRYYLWTFTWGLGWIPFAAAIAGGALLLVRRDWARALVLLPAPVLVFALIGSQGRYFSRYAMPVYPVLMLLGAFAAVALASWIAARWPRLGVAAGILVAVLMCGQGLVFAVHDDLVLSREDTRSDARAWMVRNIPPGSTILVEPLVPKEWYRDGGLPGRAGSREGYRWNRFVRTRADIRELTRQFPGARRNADFANWGFTLFPGLLDFYRERGVCWIVTGSMQSGRSYNSPERVPQAVRYYERLDREAKLVYEGSPFGAPSAGPEHPFQYDWSFDYYPLSYDRPGPVMRIYRLSGGRCGQA